MDMMRRGSLSSLVLLVALAVHATASVAPASTPKPRAARAAAAKDDPARRQRAQIEKLRKTIAGDDDPAAADAALAELKDLGEPARKALADSLRVVLARDRATIEKAAGKPGSAEKFGALLDEIDKTRKAAWENLQRLEKGEPIEKAWEYAKALAKLRRQLNKALVRRAPAAAALLRREGLLASYREAAGDAAADGQFPAAEEAELVALAEAALGMSAEEIRAIPEFAADQTAGPSDPVARHYWLYRVSRRVEAYNKSLKGVLSAGERQNLNLVNEYREALGILPYELDERLAQAARRHCKEMADLGYFSHESPTANLRSPGDRMREAGYAPDAGFAENIARGTGTGRQTFEGWFNSPGHHVNMVNADCRALGVGQWDNHWTQVMGRGARLMLTSKEQREAVKVQGEVVKPQG